MRHDSFLTSGIESRYNRSLYSIAKIKNSSMFLGNRTDLWLFNSSLPSSSRRVFDFTPFQRYRDRGKTPMQIETDLYMYNNDWAFSLLCTVLVRIAV